MFKTPFVSRKRFEEIEEKLDRKANRLLDIQEAFDRHWAMIQADKAYIRHLENHIKDLEAALGKERL